jgi:16S rRNA processing protein RimM
LPSSKNVSATPALPQGHVGLGKITGLFGVRGWVKVFSHTRPKESILDYQPWLVELNGRWAPMELAEGREHGPGIVVRFKGVEDRSAAQTLLGSEIAVEISRLPKLKQGEYYWADLEGCEVTNLQDEPLGVVSHLIETGSNDVMVVKQDRRERLIPYTKHAVIEVDLKKKSIRVDWDRDF